MLISCKWLQRHVDLTGIDLDDLGNRITLNVAELEGIIRVGGVAAQAVVGHVLSAEHVEGTHLNLCQVDTGEDAPRQIICGAPNIAAGQYVPVVLPGTDMGDFVIAERKVRGHLSQGMIASESELDLSEEHEGIMVLEDAPAPGTPLTSILDVEDTLFEIDNKSLTHRPDCWGHRGIAREVAALIGRPLKPMDLEVNYTADAPFSVDIQDTDACPRYSAVCMDGVQVTPSPFWLRVLLHRVGVRAISNAVDATNFVMLDLGNPLHAFDARDISGDTITVRWATDGESFTTLDEAERALTTRDLLIADANGGIALAGVMGGLNSEIKDDTSSIVLESANFNASIVRTTSSRLGLRTDSSARFEKSLDPHLAEDASRAFCVLMAELCPTLRITSSFMDVHPEPITGSVIDLSVDLVDRRLGKALGKDTMVDYLSRLGFGVEDQGDTLRVTVPTWRATKDVSIDADLIEEIGRSYGYDNIESKPPAVTLAKPHQNKQKYFERAARAYLTQAASLDEILTYSFDSDPLLEKIDAVPSERVLLRNAISAEMPAMRTALGPNLLGALLRNERREDRVNIFEIGRVFTAAKDAGDLPFQPTTLGVLIADATLKDDTDAPLFSRLKGVVMGLSQAVERTRPRLVQGGVEQPWAHPVRQARVMVGGTCLGYIAEVHPLTLHALDLKHRAAIMELDLDAWRATTPAAPAYAPLPRFPAVFRDFAVVVDEATRADDVKDAIAQVDRDAIRAVEFQSVFRGGGLPDGQKSMAWSVTIMDEERTLEDGEVRALEEQIWNSLRAQVGGTQRS